MSIKKWQELIDWTLSASILWAKAWQPFREEKINSFLWQVVFFSLATNRWLFPNLPRSHEDTHCTRCHAIRVEDLVHCLCECPKARRIQTWTRKLVRITTTSITIISFLVTRALIVEPLSIHIPQGWWRLLCATTIWHIWLVRNQEVIPKRKVSTKEMKLKIWLQVMMNIHNEWTRRANQCNKGVIIEQKVQESLKINFGQCDVVYTTQTTKIHHRSDPTQTSLEGY